MTPTKNWQNKLTDYFASVPVKSIYYDGLGRVSIVYTSISWYTELTGEGLDEEYIFSDGFYGLSVIGDNTSHGWDEHCDEYCN